MAPLADAMRFVHSEKVNLAFVMLNAIDFENKAEVTDEEVEEYFETTKDNYTKDNPTKEKNTRKTEIPENFTVSERVNVWAKRKGFSRLEEHLEHFVMTAEARGYKYKNWDSAFMKAISDDWAKLRNRSVMDELEEYERGAI